MNSAIESKQQCGPEDNTQHKINTRTITTTTHLNTALYTIVAIAVGKATSTVNAISRLRVLDALCIAWPTTALVTVFVPNT